MRIINFKTDGVGWVKLPDIKYLIGIKPIEGFRNKFLLSEGIWFFPIPVRITLIPETVYDLDSKPTLPKGFYVLRKTKDYHPVFNILSLEEEDVFDLLKEDITWYDKGNLNRIWAKLKVYDRVYGIN